MQAALVIAVIAMQAPAPASGGGTTALPAVDADAVR